MSGKFTDPTSAMTVSENCGANFMAAIAQLGERQTEDLKVPGSMPGLGMESDSCGGRCIGNEYISYLRLSYS